MGTLTHFGQGAWENGGLLWSQGRRRPARSQTSYFSPCICYAPMLPHVNFLCACYMGTSLHNDRTVSTVRNLVNLLWPGAGFVLCSARPSCLQLKADERLTRVSFSFVQKHFHRIILRMISVLFNFQSFQSSTCRQKEFKVKCSLGFHIWIQISY